MVKRKKESRGDGVSDSAQKKGMEVQTETAGNVGSEQNEPDPNNRAEMKGSGVVNGDNGPTQQPDEGQSEEHKVVRAPPPLNHPFLRSSVKRKKKDPTPPPSPPKPEETEKVEVKPDRKRCWEAWSNGESTLFFEAVNEYGKDFDAIQKYIEQRHKKLGLATHQVKNKNQVRHLYYRTCHKLFSFINPKPDQEKTISELLVLVNFGELRKKLNLKGGITPKVGQRLNQLVTSGQTVIRVRGANRRIKTPLCKALRKLKGDENKSDPYKLPAHVLIELLPKDNKTWASVQGTAHNPRVRLMTSLKKNLGSIISYLNDKWTPHRAKLHNTLSSTDNRKSILQLKLVLPEGVGITPHNQVTGRYMHSDSRAVFSLDNESRVNKAVAASRAAKIRPAAVGNTPILLGRAPAGSSLDCTKDIPGLDKATAEKTACDNTGKPRKYKPRKKAKLSKTDDCSNDTGDHEAQSGIGAPAYNRRKSEDTEPMEFARCESSKSPTILYRNESEKMDVEEGTEENVDEPTIPLDEGAWTIVPMKEMTKDQQLMGGLRADNSKNLTMTDIYLMLNMPIRVKFEYELISVDGGLDEDNPSSGESSKILQKLFTLASTEFADIRKPRRSISVGTVTSPPRFNVLPGTNTTPPSKSLVSQTSKSPGSVRGSGVQRHATSNGEMRGTTRVATKSVAATNNKDAGVFLTPAVPTSQSHSQPQRLTSAESDTIAAEKLFMAQIESLQKQPTFLKPNNRRGRKPLVVQRTLLPRPQSEYRGPTRHMMSMTKTGQFKPVTLGIPEGMRQKPIIRPVPIAPVPVGASRCSTIRPTAQPVPSSTSPLTNFNVTSSVGSPGQTIVVSHINTGDVVGATASPAESLSTSTSSSQLPGGMIPMNEIEAASAAAGIDTTLCPSPPDQAPITHPSSVHSNPNNPADPNKTPMLNPSPQTIDDTMQIVSVTPGVSFDTPAIPADSTTSLGQSFGISPSNLSSLLDLSLSSPAAAAAPAGGGGDALMDIKVGSELFTGFEQQFSPSTNNPSVMLPSMSPMREPGTTTPPLQMHSPSSSPFKLGPLGLDNQWLNGENTDISFNSILANLESPEKKERQSTGSSSSLVVPPPILMNESSRDSTVSMDVDTHLQYMMNENSIDNVARFADLAAHITAQQEAQREAAVTN